MEYSATDTPALSALTDLQYMFYSAASFDGDISGWDVSSVTNMRDMFNNADSFNQDLSGWDVSSVRNMHAMFFGADSFNQDLSGWDVSSVTDMSNMFALTASFDGDLSDWDVSSVTDMADMLRATPLFDSDISGGEITEDMRLNSVLYQADSFEQNLGKWYVVLDDDAVRPSDVPGIVGYVAARNPYLDGQNPAYWIGTGGDSTHFEMKDGALRMESVPGHAGPYTVNVTSSGGWGTGNSRTLEITVSDSAEPAPAGPLEVANVTISSTQPGTISVGWDAPSDSSTKDYRIVWTKAGEPFKNIRDQDHNAFPTDPQYTITGLEEGEEYEVKVRTRYAGSPNGPWSDVLAITVAGFN